MSWKLGIAYIVLLLTTATLMAQNSYLEFRPIEATVLRHHLSQGKYASTAYLVIQTREWGICSIAVGPATYELSSDGDTRTFHLRKMDCAQTFAENVIFFFGQAILGVLSGVATLCYAISAIHRIRSARRKQET